MAKLAVILSTLFVVLAPASAQVSSQSVSSSSGSFSGSMGFGRAFAMPAITGQPYSGEEINENVKVLSDGTRITQQNMMRKIWRDSAGRTRTERTVGMGPNQAAFPSIAEITDPVAGYKYTLDSEKKIAHRQALPAPPSRPAGVAGGSVGSGPAGVVYGDAPRVATAVPAGIALGGVSGGVAATLPPPGASPAGPAMRPRISRESLGSQNIEGVMAEGNRMTSTYPVGMMGNDREFSSVNETWVSPELKVTILSKTNDPRNGESTLRLRNISRNHPDPLLFSVPPDYTVVDETDHFTIEFHGRN
jgi:hypothetical protein